LRGTDGCLFGYSFKDLKAGLLFLTILGLDPKLEKIHISVFANNKIIAAPL